MLLLFSLLLFSPFISSFRLVFLGRTRGSRKKRNLVYRRSSTSYKKSGINCIIPLTYSVELREFTLSFTSASRPLLSYPPIHPVTGFISTFVYCFLIFVEKQKNTDRDDCIPHTQPELRSHTVHSARTDELVEF